MTLNLRRVPSSTGSRRVAAVLIVLIWLAGPVARVQPVGADSLGIYPTQIALVPVLRTGIYLRTIGIINNSSAARTFRLQVTGEIAPWADFVGSADRSGVITTVVAQPGPPTKIVLRVHVPSTTADGDYRGAVVVDAQPGSFAGPKSGQSVSLSTRISVMARVSGTQVVAGGLLDAYTAGQIEVGYPLRVFTVVTNTGNVEVRPTIALTASRVGTTVFGHQFNDQPVRPGAGPTKIESAWSDTAAAPLGNYTAHVSVSMGSLPLGVRDLRFQIVPYGTLRRRGTLDGLVLTNHPKPGEAAVIGAVVHNTGLIETRPVFHGEIYINDRLVSGLASIPVLTLAGDTQRVQMVVTIAKAGNYRVTGRANFDGVESNERTLTFRLGGSPSSAIPLVTGGAVVLVLLGVIGWWWKRTRPQRSRRDRRASAGTHRRREPSTSGIRVDA